MRRARCMKFRAYLTSRAKPPRRARRAPGHRTHAAEHRHRPAHPRQDPPFLAPPADRTHARPTPQSTQTPLSASAAHATAVAWPTPIARRISDAAASCTATEMRCITNGMYLRVDHVASVSYSPCVSLLARASAAPLSSSSSAGPIPPVRVSVPRVCTVRGRFSARFRLHV